ncbi:MULTISPECIES: hypothetical protein [Mycobacteroides]|uniref:Uncharacterized protein n=1 Tax=Mycobacteroides chelonae TaxID=1774 RepID=A0AB73TXP2_MYCCH|nr:MULTISPECIES: hypothetical protein [Mycobacteroides]QDF69412.1 hypothetical protein FJK96_03990 [Mycobacteroides chelonae]CPR84232.1 Uncharacterised protein [Mycobacteroides abscessus]CPS03650.1 Uncharacterised protein [Mycobacteroides abscessus]CPT03953.1 Uncharacterised protein [Mycobacteroides abscessus]CPU33244.1 Uncharacterised protein [Mycobacteroides abscessus]
MSYQTAILIGLQGKHIYGGTVPEAEVQRRRAKNRAARDARRGNVAALRKQARLNRATLTTRHRVINPFNRPIEAEVVELSPDDSPWAGLHAAYQRLGEAAKTTAEAAAGLKVGAAE